MLMKYPSFGSAICRAQSWRPSLASSARRKPSLVPRMIFPSASAAPRCVFSGSCARGVHVLDQITWQSAPSVATVEGGGVRYILPADTIGAVCDGSLSGKEYAQALTSCDTFSVLICFKGE